MDPQQSGNKSRINMAMPDYAVGLTFTCDAGVKERRRGEGVREDVGHKHAYQIIQKKAIDNLNNLSGFSIIKSFCLFENSLKNVYQSKTFFQRTPELRSLGLIL